MKTYLTLVSILAVLFGTSLSAFASNYYVEVSPTYLTSKTSTSGNRTGLLITNDTVKTNLVGATIGFGRQINQWNQVQVHVGYLTASSSHATGGATNFSGYDYDRDYSGTYTLIPILVSYNFTWNFVKNFTLKVGPTVGFTVYESSGNYVGLSGDNFSFSNSTNSFSYGANLALKWDVSSKVYIQVGARWLNVKMNGIKTYIPSAKTDTISGVLTVGWEL